MKCAIYGANLSGYYATRLSDFQNNEILYYIDREPQNKFYAISNDATVYSNVLDVPHDLLWQTELVIVAIGDKWDSYKVKEELKLKYNCPIYSIHENPYYEYMQLLKGKAHYSSIKYLAEIGYYKSVELRESVDKDGMPIPWFSYALFEFLKDRVKGSFKVFEWGSGNSTLWWEKHVNKVISVENNKAWFHDISGKVNNEKVEVIYKDLEYGGEYSKSILSYHDIDIAIVDGRDRVNCAKLAVQSLNSEGVIIWDDTERTYYQEGYQYLFEHGFKMITFSSLKGIDANPSHTSVFYRERNCLNI